jgi:hypothetical protein
LARISAISCNLVINISILLVDLKSKYKRFISYKKINMHQISPIKNKILQYIEYKGISKYKFYQESGITRGVLDKESGISEDNIAKFIAYAPEVDLSWLF